MCAGPPLPSPATPRLKKDRIMTQPYVDPIAHAWRHCNPQAQLPSALAQHSAPSAFRLMRYASDGQLGTERSWTSRDIQHGLLTIATLPRISSTTAVDEDDSEISVAAVAGLIGA